MKCSQRYYNQLPTSDIYLRTYIYMYIFGHFWFKLVRALLRGAYQLHCLHFTRVLLGVPAPTRPGGRNRRTPVMAASSLTYYPPGSASGPAFAAITHGFVLTSDFTMVDVKTLASTLAWYKEDTVSWRYILNNTTSTRPDICGGATCNGLKKLLAYHRVSALQANSAPLFAPGSARADESTGYLNECPKTWWCAILPLPNSFSMDDQRSLKVAAAAKAQSEAMQKVSLMAFVLLLLRGPTLVLLRSNHWSVNVTAVQQAAFAISGVQPPASVSGLPLAPAPPPRSRKAFLYYEPPAEGAEQERDDLICEILTKMIRRSPTGWVNPSATLGDWRQLRRYVYPRGLAKFIREHAQFQLAQDTGTTWEFSFAGRGRSDPPDVHAPVSDSAAPRALCDVEAVTLELERDILIHRCEHGAWWTRSARPLCPGHALATFDLIAPPPSGRTFPDCCRPCPREERYDEQIGKWIVWSPEDDCFVEEDEFYVWADFA